MLVIFVFSEREPGSSAPHVGHPTIQTSETTRQYGSLGKFYHVMLSHHVDTADNTTTLLARLVLAVRIGAQNHTQWSEFVLSLLPTLYSTAFYTATRYPPTSSPSAHYITTSHSTQNASHIRKTTRRLAELLSSNGGQQEDNNELLLPLAASFGSFLESSLEESPFSHIVEAHQDAAATCIDIMIAELLFNICDFPSSFMCNVDVYDLMDVANARISPRLRYACRYWTHHTRAVPYIGEPMLGLMTAFFMSHFLSWLEVMSILGLSPVEALEKLDVTIASRFLGTDPNH